MDDAKRMAERLRSAEVEVQVAQRAFDGSDQARRRYARALQNMEQAHRMAVNFVRNATARN